MPDQQATLGLFSTPVLRTLAGRQASLSELEKFILEREDHEHQHKNSPQAAHNALFESRFDLFSWPETPIQELKSHLYQLLMRYVAEINGFDSKALESLRFKHESWFHITRSGGYFQPHTHPLASVSMIYCVNPGDAEISDERSSGQVVFIDPRHNASMYLDPANRQMSRPFSFDGLRFRLQADEVFIFPSYLQHSVEPYSGDMPRITIAANFSFALK